MMTGSKVNAASVQSKAFSAPRQKQQAAKDKLGG
jgi:hypothetical protein